MPYDLSIIIPAYNEERQILDTVQQTLLYLKKNKLKGEIIVVDDGSSDATQGVLKHLKSSTVKVLTNTPNKGKGFSVKRGMMVAKGAVVLFMDADLSTPLFEIRRGLDALKGHDIVVGSRALKESKLEVHQPLLRLFMGRVFSIIVRLLTVKGIKDTQCGFKMFTKKAAKDIFRSQTIDRWGFDVEVLFIAQKRKYSIVQLPVTWRDCADSRVSPVRDSIRMLGEILRIWRNNLKGVYRRQAD